MSALGVDGGIEQGAGGSEEDEGAPLSSVSSQGGFVALVWGGEETEEGESAGGVVSRTCFIQDESRLVVGFS